MPLVADAERPLLTHGIQIGDVLGERAIVWSRSDRPARLILEWDVSARFGNPRRVIGPHALEASDYTARVDLTELPRDREIFLRVSFQGLTQQRALSEPVYGRFQSAPYRRGSVRFVWGADTAGQGFGINPEFGGMRIYETMRKRRPDFFLHSGDNIYADGPIPGEKTVEDGKVWRNLVTPEKSKVAETLDEFRGNYKYNLLDDNVRRFNAEVPQVWQWDDHEVTNNWSSSGPQVVFQKAPPAQNYSPFGGYQFFGQVDIDERSRTMQVSLVDLDGNTVFVQTLEPRG